MRCLQVLLMKLYQLNIITEKPYLNGDSYGESPLLLEKRTYNELQILKNELGIKGYYF